MIAHRLFARLPLARPSPDRPSPERSSRRPSHPDQAGLALVLALLLAGPAPLAAQPFRDVHGDPSVPFRPVGSLDLARYAGIWHEIARFPNRHQRNCHAVRARYSPRPDGHYDVGGWCPERVASGNNYEVTGVARRDGPGELSLGVNSWLPFFRRSVFVLGVSEDYSVAVIGEPRRKYGWIMARSPSLSPAQSAWALGVMAANGFDTALLEYPEQGRE